MNRSLLSVFASGAAVVLAASLAPAPAHAAATITIVNMDGPGEGFNDPTAAAPIDGNPGTTIGQQRLNAFQHAADIWGAVLDSSIEIKIQSSFDPLTCTPTGAVLGAAGAIQIFADSDDSVFEYANTWYHVALANKLFGDDLAPGASGTDADDIVAFFNSNLNGNPACLGGRGWYYGFDGDVGAEGTNIDLIAVLLHEFGHGLGFANFVTEATGTRPLGLGDIYSQYTLDVTTGEIWNDMTNAERQASAINSRKVVWNGCNVDAASSSVLSAGTPLLTVNSPAGIAGVYSFGVNAFSGPLSPEVTADVVAATDIDEDDGGPNTTLDACSPLDNAAEVAGKIALVDRGVCPAVTKVQNCEAAGAVGVLIANNVAGAPPAGFTGVLASAIPSGMITQADGALVRSNLGTGVNATLGLDLDVLAGTEASTGFVHLNAPNPVAPGSSISHWDPITSPSQLMEPAINANLTHSLQPPEDLTLMQMTDIGWFSDQDGFPDGDCSEECLGSDLSETVVIDGCDSGAENDLLSTGCTITDEADKCASAATTHEEFTACMTQVTNRLVKMKIITNKEKSQIQKCAGLAAIP